MSQSVVGSKKYTSYMKEVDNFILGCDAPPLENIAANESFGFSYSKNILSICGSKVELASEGAAVQIEFNESGIAVVGP